MKALVFVLALIASMVSPARVRGEATPANTFVIGIEALDYMPYYGIVDGEVDGAVRDLLDAFAADHGYRFIYRPLPIRRLFAELQRGGIDFKFPENPIWDHPEKENLELVYSQPLLLATDASFVLSERLDGIRGPGDVKSLGKILGFDLPFWRNREVIEVQNLGSLIRLAEAGRVDAVHANVAVLEEALRREGRTGLIVRHPALPGIDYDYRLGTARHAGVVQQLNAWIIAHPERVRSIADRRRVPVPAS